MGKSKTLKVGFSLWKLFDNRGQEIQLVIYENSEWNTIAIQQ